MCRGVRCSLLAMRTAHAVLSIRILPLPRSCSLARCSATAKPAPMRQQVGSVVKTAQQPLRHRREGAPASRHAMRPPTRPCSGHHAIGWAGAGSGQRASILCCDATATACCTCRCTGRRTGWRAGRSAGRRAATAVAGSQHGGTCCGGGCGGCRSCRADVAHAWFRRAGAPAGGVARHGLR